MAVQDEKIDNSLNLALEMPEEERAKSDALQYGSDPDTRRWQLIAKYTGDIKRFEEIYPNTDVIELLNGYAIITTREELIGAIAAMPEIDFLEKPKRLYFNLEEGRSASCINTVQKSVSGQGGTDGNGSSAFDLSGQGVLIGIIDSGIDYFHPTFRNADGESRIAFLWDQSAGEEQSRGRSPVGYDYGAQYSKEDINEALQAATRTEGAKIVPVSDRGSGHGTAVAGVAAGNGAGSAGRKYRGVATESELLVVKLGRSAQDFAGTTEVMEGLDYVIRKAISLQKPIAVNLSFGNNSNAHDGQSLFENYIAELNGVWKNVIVVASGNEGDARHHASVQLVKEEEEVLFAIGSNEKSMSLQIWKQFIDEFKIYLESPSGQQILTDNITDRGMAYKIDTDTVYIYYGSPNPYTIAQEILIEWIPQREGTFVQSGIWKVKFVPEKIKNGEINLWLPTIEAVGLSTGFLKADPDTTLTIPSTARKVITVGAYRSDNDSIASFSGRGNTTDRRDMPTIAAPGVGVVTAAAGGGYSARTGTSIAAPFVTGSAALMMEWGIVRGNDAYLYGEKVKAYLIKGARKMPAQTQVPDTAYGYGALCLKNSLPLSVSIDKNLSVS